MKRLLKKSLCCLMVVVLLMGALPMSLFAADGGSVDFSYEVYGGTTLMIYGTEIPDDAFMFANFERSDIDSVQFSDTVTVIGDRAFQGFTNLDYIILTEGLTSIGEYAFAECTSLESINLPLTLTEMGEGCFQGCASLKAVSMLGDSQDMLLQEIPDHAFDGCEELSEFEVPASCISIGDYAFYGCRSLRKITTPSAGGDEPSTDPSQPSEPGTGGSGDVVVLPGVGGGGGVVILPGTGGDDGYSSLLPGTGGDWGGTILPTNPSDQGLLMLPDTLVSLGEYAFSSCGELVSVTLPCELTTMGAHCFSYCINLYEVIIPNDAPLQSIPDWAFESCFSLEDFDLPSHITSIGEGALYGCRLSSITVPDSVEFIGREAFGNNPSLISVTINADSRLSDMDRYVFIGCDMLMEIVNNSAYEIIDDYDTLGTASLKTIHAGESWIQAVTETSGEDTDSYILLPYGETSVSLIAYRGTSIVLQVPSTFEIDGNTRTLTDIGSYAFASGILHEVRLPGVSLPLPDDFKNQFVEVTVPDSVKTIGSFAFRSCRSLETVHLPDGVEVLSTQTFAGCSSLHTVKLPSTLKLIESDAFSYCESLEEIFLPDGLEYISSYVFDGCNSLTSVYIPPSVIEIDEYAFANPSPELVISGEAGSLAEEYALEHNIYFETLIQDVSNVTVSIKTPSDSPINEGVSVKWYDADKNYIFGGKTLTNATPGETYYYTVTFDNAELNMEWVEPEGFFQVTAEKGGITESVILSPVPTASVWGTLTDEVGNPIANAQVTVTQTFAPNVTATTYTVTSANGTFAFTAKAVSTIVEFEADGYYGRLEQISARDLTTGNYQIKDVALKALSTNKIDLSLFKCTATEMGASDTVVELTFSDHLSFTIFNQTKGRAVEVFAVQSSAIYLGAGEAEPYDRLAIHVTDTSGVLADVSVTVTLNELMLGSASLIFTEKGSVRITLLDGADQQTVMIFDENGKFLSSKRVSSFYSSNPLDAGGYTLLVMEYHPSFFRFSDLSCPEKLGLTEQDYRLLSLTVADGKISVIDSVTVPAIDTVAINYTVPESTLVTSLQSSVAVGRYVNVRCEYAVKNTYNSSNQTIVIDLPEGLLFAEGSLVLDGAPVPCSYADGTLTVYAGQAQGVLHFYVVATTEGTHTAQAYIQMNIDGNEIMQSIGSLNLRAESSIFNVVEKTAKKTITVSGMTLPQSRVTVYDKDKILGTTVANKVGSWSLKVTLDNTFTHSVHPIYTVIENDHLVAPLRTAETVVVYDVAFVNLSKVTMINPQDSTEQVTVFDFIKPENSSPNYTYIPFYPNFTFVVEFDGNAENVKDVIVVILDPAGVEHYVSCTYDKAKNAFVGAASFDSSTAPTSFSVNYNYVGELQYSKEFYLQAQTEAEEIWSDLQKEAEECLEITNFRCEDDIFAFDVMDKSINQLYAIGMLYPLDYEEVDPEDPALVDRESEGETLKFKMTVDESSVSILMINPVEEKANELRITLDVPSTYGISLGTGAGLASSTKESINMFYYATMYYQLQDMWDKEIAEYDEYYMWLRQNALYRKCPDGTYRLSPANMQIAAQLFDINESLAHAAYSAFLDDLERYRERVLGHSLTYIVDVIMGHHFEKKGTAWLKANAEKYRLDEAQNFFNFILATDSILSFQTAGDYDSYASATFSTLGYIGDEAYKVQSILSMIWDKGNHALGIRMDPSVPLAMIDMLTAISNKNKALLTETVKWIGENMKKCDDDDDDDGDDDDNKPNNPPRGDNNSSPVPMNPIIDPSGFVCEAVPSNRLEGVKAEAYYYDYVLDDFGMPTGEMEEILWDASEYGQVNPLYTDKNGRYAWDVPMGRWLVRFSKDGYISADTKGDKAADSDGYLPVPPPQTDVNIALVSTAQPIVSEVYTFTDCVRIKFSQYMNIDSVIGSAITVTCNGSVVSGTVRPLNAEASFNDPSIFYADTFVFETATLMSGEVQINVNGAVNYAGNAMNNSYDATQTAVALPDELIAPDTIDVEYASGALVSIQLNDSVAGANQILRVTSMTPSIFTVMESEIVTDAQGRATVMIMGNLPGTGLLEIKLPGTDLIHRVSITVAKPEVYDENKCQPVKADVASDSQVKKGTVVTLTTDTDGAEIYYTLDKSCPCDKDNPARQKYTAPFVITEDVFIIAYAVKEGMADSGTAGFAYSVLPDAPITDPDPDIDPMPSHEHTWGVDYVVDREATCTESGSKSIHCTTCDEVKDVTKIPSIGHRYENGLCTVCGAQEHKTDGKFPILPVILVCIGICIIGGGVAVFFVIRKKKGTKSREE